MKFHFDALYFQLKNSVTIMECLMTETEDIIKKSILEFNIAQPKMHSIDYDDDRNSDEYYSYKNFASYVFEDVVENYTQTLPSSLRKSVFLTIYGMLEFYTSEFCKNKIECISFPLKLNELHGQGMERCNVFLNKVIGMRHSENMKLLTHIAKLRNVCVHNNGIINKNNNNINAIIKDLTRLSDDALCLYNETIVFNEGALPFIIDKIKIYFDDIGIAIEEYNKRI